MLETSIAVHADERFLFKIYSTRPSRKRLLTVHIQHHRGRLVMPRMACLEITLTTHQTAAGVLPKGEHIGILDVHPQDLRQERVASTVQRTLRKRPFS